MDEDGDEGDDASSSDAETSDNGGVTTSGWCGGDGSIGNSNRQKKHVSYTKTDIGHYLYMITIKSGRDHATTRRCWVRSKGY